MIFYSCTTDNSIDWRKYDVITNVDELSDYYPELNLDRNGNYEKAYLSNYFDGTKELVYEYELLDSENYDPLFYSITIETTNRIKDAKDSFRLTKSALKTGNRIGSMRLEEVEIELPGDENYYAIRTLNGAPSGLLYISRRGRNVYSLIVSGIYSDDHSIITDLINPEISSLDQFSLK